MLRVPTFSDVSPKRGTFEFRDLLVLDGHHLEVLELLLAFVELFQQSFESGSGNRLLAFELPFRLGKSLNFGDRLLSGESTS